MDETLPVEVAFERAKKMIIDTINDVVSTTGLPSGIVFQLFENVLLDIKATSYSAILREYDIVQKIESEENNRTVINMTPEIRRNVERADNEEKVKAS